MVPGFLTNMSQLSCHTIIPNMGRSRHRDEIRRTGPDQEQPISTIGGWKPALMTPDSLASFRYSLTALDLRDLPAPPVANLLKH